MLRAVEMITVVNVPCPIAPRHHHEKFALRGTLDPQRQPEIGAFAEYDHVPMFTVGNWLGGASSAQPWGWPTCSPSPHRKGLATWPTRPACSRPSGWSARWLCRTAAAPPLPPTQRGGATERQPLSEPISV